MTNDSKEEDTIEEKSSTTPTVYAEVSAGPLKPDTADQIRLSAS